MAYLNQRHFDFERLLTYIRGVLLCGRPYTVKVAEVKNTLPSAL